MMMTACGTPGYVGEKKKKFNSKKLIFPSTGSISTKTIWKRSRFVVNWCHLLHSVSLQLNLKIFISNFKFLDYAVIKYITKKNLI